MKKMPTVAHGVLDYLTGALMMSLPKALGLSKPVSRLLEASGAAAIGYSLATNYELGLIKALPMKAHLTLDALSGAALLVSAAYVFEDEDPEVRFTLAGLGAFEVAAALLTQTRPGACCGTSATNPVPASALAQGGGSRSTAGSSTLGRAAQSQPRQSPVGQGI